MSPTRNRLGDETSPYLLQHADNPVHWYPWGPEALDLAQRLHRPILLSIGYSACHWCHVMAHESFENEATAKLMNELFINIKVDREERPDLDKIYQNAHQLIAQRPGGWPLTMFLSAANQIPFFGGTYFPDQARHGLIAFSELLRRVAEYFRDHEQDIGAQNQAMLDALAGMEGDAGPAGGALDALPLEMVRKQLSDNFDAQHGGFGQAPKFPHPTNIERLLRHHGANPADREARHQALYTLERMARGGLFDQLGGGFCRYSVDEQWMIPHFEKMLYDNGPLLGLYAEAWQLGAEPLFRDTALATANWVLREMQSPAGGYYSSLDADSEGEEGRFYVWSREDVQARLNVEQYNAFAACYGLDRAANFEGLWYPHGYRSEAEVAAHLQRPESSVRELLGEARQQLLQAREKRPRPGRDDKILGSWNGLMIKGMATAGRILGQSELVDSASRAVDFIRTRMFSEGRLLATHKDGRSHLAAYLDDHAFLIDALLALLQCRWRREDLDLAVRLADIMLEYFQDPANGGFFFTASDHEQLIHRSKSMADDSLPAGNAVAAQVLGRLGHLLGESRYLDAAERTLKAAWPAVGRIPYAHTAMLNAAEDHLYPGRIFILRGHGPELDLWRQRCQRDYAPRDMCLAIPAHADGLPEALADKAAAHATRAYVCEGFLCHPPVDSLTELEGWLDHASK